MRKIYNEIAIDMNPESSNYEKVLFEDSYLHDGPMMLMYSSTDLTWLQDWYGGTDDDIAHHVVPGGTYHDYDPISETDAAVYKNVDFTKDLSTNMDSLGGHQNPATWNSSTGSGGYWQRVDPTEWMEDNTTGYRARRFKVKTADVFEQWQFSGWLWEVQQINAGGGWDHVGWKKFSHIDYGSGPEGSSWFTNLREFTKSKGRPEWAYKSHETLVSDLAAHVDEGYDIVDMYQDPSTITTAADDEAEQVKIDVKREVAHSKQEAEDIAEQTRLQAQKAVARQQGATQRQLQAQLAAQTGQSPEETAALLAGGTEAIGRMQGDIIQQSNLMKNQTLGQLTQFGVTAGLSAEELGTKLKEIQSQKFQYMQGLKNQFNISQLQADTSRYGMNLDYQAALRQAQAAENAAWYGMWGDMMPDVNFSLVNK